ncbi:hypothetical protein AB0M12_21090 [Nocardia vinacea]|uniref:hypothetical protein n=1 Tax=Nocardia vinacea TaxID=96468 RepID=UPI0034352FDE
MAQLGWAPRSPVRVAIPPLREPVWEAEWGAGSPGDATVEESDGRLGQQLTVAATGPNCDDGGMPEPRTIVFVAY